MGCSLSSKLVADAELCVARRVTCGSRVHNAEGWILIRVSRESESRCVGEVEEVGMQFELVLSRHRDVLREGDIEVVDTIGANVGKIAWSIAGLLIARIGKAVLSSGMADR